MSNPLDTDAGSELFESYSAEFRLVEADLQQKLDQIPELTGEPRKAAIGQAERALEEAEELLGQMQLEKSNIPTPQRARANQRFRDTQTAIDQTRRKLRHLAEDRSALFGARESSAHGGGGGLHGGDGGDGRYSDNPEHDQRQQLLSGSDRLDRSTQRLKASQRLANETEMIGAATLGDLHRQRGIIEHTNDTLLRSEGYVDRSVKTLRGMARRMATNRVITVAIITLLVLLILAVIFSKFR